MKRLLSGNEAVARGAWEAGCSVASGYPGTPSTEILENFARYPNVYAEWAPNEKVGLDSAIGAAYAGKAFDLHHETCWIKRGSGFIHVCCRDRHRSRAGDRFRR